MKKKQITHNNLESIEESLERISCSVAQIYGVLDALLQEVSAEKERTPDAPGPPPSFDHEEIDGH